jgi:hypothetical protein
MRRKLVSLAIVSLMLVGTFAIFQPAAMAAPNLTLKWTRPLGAYAMSYTGPLAADVNGDGNLLGPDVTYLVGYWGC